MLLEVSLDLLAFILQAYRQKRPLETNAVKTVNGLFISCVLLTVPLKNSKKY
jgi:hypothetical protein